MFALTTYFALLVAGVVTQVLVIDPVTMANRFPNATAYRQTFVDASARKNYAGVAYTYNSGIDAFVPPQPYPSWSTLNPVSAQWMPPVPMPLAQPLTPNTAWIWQESTQSWIAF